METDGDRYRARQGKRKREKRGGERDREINESGFFREHININTDG